MSKKWIIGSFLLGGAIGATVALLFAPRSGSETRALVADKVEEAWGQGQLYTKNAYAKIQPVISQKNDELREKIENARAAIAEQVAKNAAAACNAINEKVPVASEKITQAVDVVKGKIDAAASKKVADDAVEAPEATDAAAI
ncbi:MAG: YtxH domain-containing protein [Coriobacteriia bacterium]|nr:YtxH domain-containing protein [Coriobacteriia bacterium]